MKGTLKTEKDKLSLKALECCENCDGDGCKNPACPLRQKRQAQKAEPELLVPPNCSACMGFSCLTQEVCDGTACPTEIGIPCCKVCPKNLKTAS